MVPNKTSGRLMQSHTVLKYICVCKQYKYIQKKTFCHDPSLKRPLNLLKQLWRSVTSESHLGKIQVSFLDSCHFISLRWGINLNSLASWLPSPWKLQPLCLCHLVAQLREIDFSALYNSTWQITYSWEKPCNFAVSEAEQITAMYVQSRISSYASFELSIWCDSEYCIDMRAFGLLGFSASSIKSLLAVSEHNLQ